MGAEASDTLYYLMLYRPYINEIGGFRTESEAATCCSNADDIANLDDVEDLTRVNYSRDPCTKRYYYR